MRLLVVTQVVDVNDPVLGFFHRWLEVFATRFERIEVICLQEGEHTLPKNVRVHSLGKERGKAVPLVYAFRFMKLVWKLRNQHEGVFVHMNAEYVVLAGGLWRLLRKRVALWYNHTVGSTALKLAVPFASRLFHTSPYAYPSRYKLAKQMPAGIDTDVFVPSTTIPDAHTVYFQGRIARAKRVHVLLAAVNLLRSKGVPVRATIVGPEESVYAAEIRTQFSHLIEQGSVVFTGPKRNEETPALYQNHAVSVNLTDDGNFDKTVLESLACGTPVVVSSNAFVGTVPQECITNEAKENTEVLAEALQRIWSKNEEERALLAGQGRDSVIKLHSLPTLADTLRDDYNTQI